MRFDVDDGDFELAVALKENARLKAENERLKQESALLASAVEALRCAAVDWNDNGLQLAHATLLSSKALSFRSERMLSS